MKTAVNPARIVRARCRCTGLLMIGQWPQLATYGASFLTIGVICRHLLRPEVTARSLRSISPRFGLGLLTYAVAIGLAFVSATLVVILFAATAIYYAFNQLPWATEKGA